MGRNAEALMTACLLGVILSLIYPVSSSTLSIMIYYSLFLVSSWIISLSGSVAFWFLSGLSAQSLKSDSDLDLFFNGLPFDGDGIKL